MAASSSNSNNLDRGSKRPAPLWLPRIISLGPGGEKGYVELGVLHILFVRGFLTKVHTYIGCSVGSAIALLMISGYEPSTIISRTMAIDIFKDLQSIDISKLKTKGGVLSNAILRNFLTHQLVLRWGYVPTFEQLHKLTNMNLTVVSTNLNQGQPVYFSHQTHPDMSVVDAVALSANIPGVFQRIQYDGDTYIDGAFADPHPINYYDDGQTSILGLYITTKHTEPEEPSSPDDVFDVANYFIRTLYSTMTVLRREKQRHISAACRQLRLFVRDQIQLSVSNKPRLVCDGISIGNQFIQSLMVETWTQ